MAVDTHRAIKKLKEVGFDEAQAEAVVRMVGEAFDDSAATKVDIAELRIEIQEVRADLSTQGAELRGEIQEVRGEIREARADLSTQGAESRAEAKAIRAELRELEQRMTIKLGGLLVLALTLLTAINKWIG